jgi:hypothetical protein
MYAATYIDGKFTMMHELVVACPKGMVRDHKDRNGLNNQKANLRIATHSQNQANSPPRNGRRYKGVYTMESGRWRAQIQFNHKLYYLGSYDTAKEAAKSYDKKAHELYGEFAYLNFPKELGK